MTGYPVFVVKAWCLGGVALFGVALTAHADLTTLSLEDLLSSEVISASRFPQQAREAPSAVSVITAREIREHGWRTLAEALANVRGTVTANDRGYSYIGPRGFLRPGDYNTNLLLLVDGVRINDNIYHGAPMGGEFPLDMELIERIEFVPGPGASVYGNNAFLGVVNVVTRSGSSYAGTEANVGVGTHGMRRVHASMGNAGKGQDWLVSVSHASSKGHDFYYPELDQPGNNNGRADDLDGEQVSRAYAHLRRGDLQVSGLWADRVKANPTAPFDSLVGDARSELQDRHAHVMAHYDHDLTTGLKLSVLADYGDYHFRNDSPGDRTVVLGDPNLYRDNAYGRWLNLQARATDARMPGHKWVYGVEWQKDLKNLQQGVDMTSGAPYADISARRQTTAVYSQDEWRLSPVWLLNLGARYDYHEGLGGALNPRLGLIQQISPRTTVKYLYGSAYRAPTAYELAYDDAASGTQSMKGNPDLKAERIRTYEMTLEHESATHWLYTGTLFHYRIRDLINQIQDPLDSMLVYVNQNRVSASGLGMQAERRWQDGTHLRVSLNRQQAEDELGQRVTHSPDVLAKLLATIPLGTWRAGMEAHYTGARQTTGGNSAAGFWLVHANLMAPRSKGGGEFSLRVTNLFNQHYDDPGGAQHEQTLLPQDGRALEVRYAWMF